MILYQVERIKWRLINHICKNFCHDEMFHVFSRVVLVFGLLSKFLLACWVGSNPFWDSSLHLLSINMLTDDTVPGREDQMVLDWSHLELFPSWCDASRNFLSSPSSTFHGLSGKFQTMGKRQLLLFYNIDGCWFMFYCLKGVALIIIWRFQLVRGTSTKTIGWLLRRYASIILAVDSALHQFSFNVLTKVVDLCLNLLKAFQWSHFNETMVLVAPLDSLVVATLVHQLNVR
jgi:hypothetical protein